MLFEYIENARSKSVETRKHYAMVFSITVTVLVALLWIVTLFFKGVGTGEYAAKKELESEGETTSDLFRSSNQFLNASTFAPSKNAPMVETTNEASDVNVWNFDTEDSHELTETGNSSSGSGAEGTTSKSTL